MKRAIIMIGAFFFLGSVYSVTEDPNNEVQDQIEKLIEFKNWEALMEKAHLMLLNDPDEAEGYYYTALAYYHLESWSKAKPYLKYAKRLKDKRFDQRIAELEVAMGMKKALPVATSEIETKEIVPKVKLKDRFYVGYDFHDSHPLGIYMGYLRHRGVGSYLSIRSNQEIFTKTGGFEVRSSGRPYVSEEGFEHTGEIRHGAIEGVMGLTWKVKGPVWMYSGAGLNHRRTFFEMVEPEVDPEAKSWAKSPQTFSNTFALESGFILDFKSLNFKVGAVANNLDLKSLRLQAGIGFSFKQK